MSAESRPTQPSHSQMDEIGDPSGSPDSPTAGDARHRGVRDSPHLLRQLIDVFTNHLALCLGVVDEHSTSFR
jgi:hypothetical protein